MENWNSIKNQEIKGKFANREVLAPVNLLVEYILSREDPDAPFSLDDIAHLYYYTDADGNHYSETEKIYQLETWQEALEEAEILLEEDPDNTALISRISALENDIEALENTEQQMWEIYEWWIVTPWLANELKAYSKPILTDGQNYYWGRCTTGQAILLDRVISRICEDLEILQGMSNAWL